MRSSCTIYQKSNDIKSYKITSLDWFDFMLLVISSAVKNIKLLMR